MALMRSFFIVGLVLLSVINVEAVEFLVGGKDNSWRIPTSPNDFNDWAEKERFKIGDLLVFKYDSKTDSVLQVEDGDYKKCNKTKPIKEFNDGNTKFKINESGAFYFISGADGHCEKGEKLEVKVLSHKHSSSPSTSPTQPPKASPGNSPIITVSPPPAESPKTNSAAQSNVGIAAAIVTAAFFGLICYGLIN